MEKTAKKGEIINIQGQAYIIPYKKSRKIGDKWIKRLEVNFQLGFDCIIKTIKNQQGGEWEAFGNSKQIVKE